MTCSRVAAVFFKSRWSLVPAFVPVFLLLASTLSGCATSRVYGFRPAAGAPESANGLPASRYVLPAEAPSGEIFVAAPEAQRPEGSSEEIVHVRLAVSAQANGAAWSLDPARQVLTLPTGAQLRPDYMDVPDGNRTMPFIVAPGAQRSVDLFYRLPPGHSINANVPGFALNWEVAIGDRAVAMQTPFVRQVEDYYARGPYVAVGVTPWWWYRPYWASSWYGPGYGYGGYGGYGYGGYGYGGYGYGHGFGRGGGYPRTYNSWGSPGGGFSGGFHGGGGGGWGSSGGGGGPRVRGGPVRR